MNDTTTTARERTIHTYLAARAQDVELPAGDLAAVVDRVSRRRRNRRVALTASLAVAVLGGALGAANLGDDAPSRVASDAGGTLVASDLEWHRVVPRGDLGWATSTVLGPGDALYALSTAPGTVGVIDPEPDPTPVLYRSTDGVEWATVALPDRFHASALAGAGDRLYAVGTAPAGGGAQDVRLASNDGADASWTQATLPLDLAALGRAVGGKVDVVTVRVAVRGPRTVVAVGLQSHDALDRVLPADARENGWMATAEGLDVLGPLTEPSTDPTVAGPDASAKERIAKERGAPVVVRSLRWAELGVDDATRGLVLGETRVFTSDDGATFVEADAPDASAPTALVAVTDGFRLLTQSSLGAPVVGVWSSTDGAAWRSDAGATVDGWVRTAGTVRGRAIFVSESGSGPNDREPVSVIHAQQADGTWLTLSLQDLAHRAGVEGSLYVQDVAIGPMGVAALLRTIDPVTGDATHAHLLHSVDGRTASVDDLSDVLRGAGAGDVGVTADAITIGLVDANGAPSAGLLIGSRR